MNVFALPLHTNETAETQFNTDSKALDVFDRNGREKVVSIGTYGEGMTDMQRTMISSLPANRAL